MYTENNSKEMKTVVETFVAEETVELIYDNDKLDKWNEHIESLNLKGQKSIVKPSKSPIPFLHMKQSLVRVFQTLCPRKVALEDFNISPIPLEILDLIALSTKEEYFSEIKVWYDDKNPDPAVVGEITKYGEWNNYNWNSPKEASLALGKDVSEYNRQTEHYLIGKWGDVKHSFEKLKAMAMKRHLAEKSNDLKKQMQQVKREIEDLETSTESYFN